MNRISCPSRPAPARVLAFFTALVAVLALTAPACSSRDRGSDPAGDPANAGAESGAPDLQDDRSKTPGTAPADAGASPETGPGVPLPAAAGRPRFSPDAKRITFHAGPEGQRHVYVMNADATGIRQLTQGPGDHRDPSFGPGGERIVYAASTGDRGYDLYLVDAAGGTPERLTSLEGDELEPAFSSLRYAFYAVNTDACSESGVGASQIDGYEKVAFTRRHGPEKRQEEIWFVSVQPRSAEAAQAQSWATLDTLSPHATHQGRISPRGKRCRSPYWSGDGLSLVWLCDGGPGAAVLDAEARWDQSFEAALRAIDDQGKSCDYDWDQGAWRDSACLDDLPRRYTRYPAERASEPADDLRAPAISANQIVLVAEKGGHLVHRRRDARRAAWTRFEDIPAGARHPVWSPDGARVAYELAQPDAPAIATADTDFYLQSVTNLRDFPEWWKTRTSQRLQDNHFVARPGKEKDFYILYEKLRYRRRPQLITADAALQVFRDELQVILRKAEGRAADTLRQLGKAMMDAYVAAWKQSGSDTDRYYAAYFATAWVPLEAMSRVPMPDWGDAMYGTDEDKAALAALSGPPLGRLPAALPPVYALLPAELRGEVQARVEAMLAHAGAGSVRVPGRARPARIDWTQFRPRGSYAENELAAYFLAMSWYAAAPLPFDASLPDLLERMEKTTAGGATAYELWKRIDTLVGAFMGRPVDATPAHLRMVRDEGAAAFRAFDPKPMRARLEELRGPIPVRDLEAAEGGEGNMALKVTLFPKRLGLDTTFFRALTHPDVRGRGMPSALDVMAALGVSRARTHALAVQPEEVAAAYREALDALAGEHAGGFPTTDIYHGWLAALVALARAHELPADSLLAFARTEAWRDRLLTSALGGYVELKHSAVLYNMQDMSVECAGDTPIYVLVEQPILPVPRGFVDPVPELFEALAALADRVYRELHDDPEGPSAHFWHDRGDTPLNARNFARDLARLAAKEVAGEPLTDAEHAWIDITGGRLEALLLGLTPEQGSAPAGPDTRNKRGIALITDIHTNITRQQVLEIGIGRLLDLWVVAPDVVGARLTQGGMFSFYELTAPMGGRMTDAEWHERLEAGKAPPLPAWTASFIAAP